jgi:hypothetical protein
VQKSSAAILVVLSAAISASAGARPPPEQHDNLIDDRFAMTAEFVDATNNTQLRLDSSAGTLGTVVNAESDLGLPARKVLGIGDVMFRIGSRWRMQVEYWFVPLDRSGTTTLTKTINFKDDTFQPGDQVNSQLNMHVLAVGWAYSFLRTENYELAASLGFDAIEFSAAATVSSLLSTQREDKSGPAPLAGVQGTLRLSSRWYLGGRFAYLRAGLSDVKGGVTTFEFTTLYRLNPNITFGAGYRSFHIDLTSDQVGSSGMFDLKSAGPLLLVRVGF